LRETESKRGILRPNGRTFIKKKMTTTLWPMLLIPIIGIIGVLINKEKEKEIGLLASVLT